MRDLSREPRDARETPALPMVELTDWGDWVPPENGLCWTCRKGKARVNPHRCDRCIRESDRKARTPGPRLVVLAFGPRWKRLGPATSGGPTAWVPAGKMMSRGR